MLKTLLIISCIILLSIQPPLFGKGMFIETHQQMDRFKTRKDVLMVCSPGRSGSTLLTHALNKSSPNKTILKSHLLPPRGEWKGKILFIFSNPDLSIESAFHICFISKKWGSDHFSHMETSDLQWLRNIGNTEKQTLEYNLLNYDALGIEKQLKTWLFDSVEDCSLEEANILAIKYENLWDQEVKDSIKQFCGLNHFSLPPKHERGFSTKKMSELELLIRETFNYGTFEEPMYSAYDGAREIWEESPSCQLLKLK